MKKIFLAVIYIVPLLFISCSRDEPFVAPPPPPPVQSSIKLNEIYSRGDAINPDWIEIYNNSNTQVDVSGYKIYDDGGKNGPKPKKVIPAGTVISAKGFYIIVTDDNSADSSGFGLSQNGEQVWLENASGTAIDNVIFPTLEATQSYVRYPDGTNNWSKTDSITRGVSNVFATNRPIKINEVYSGGDLANPDWIEFYNLLDSQLDISGYKIYDSDGQNGSKPKKVLPNGTIISAKGYFVLVVNDATSNGFDLSNSGEKVWFEDAAGIIVDSVEFPAFGVDTSYGRRPDGSDNWIKLSPTTKGTTNDLISTLPLVMNEIFSRGTPGNLDWIEIYNPNPTQVNLTGYKIYDAGGQSGSKPKKEFPSGATIPAGGFFVIITDTADFGGDLSGFGLSSGGEEVWFENSNGTIIDNVTIPAMPVATTSYARVPNGSATWVISNTITRGAPNQP